VCSRGRVRGNEPCVILSRLNRPDGQGEVSDDSVGVKQSKGSLDI
jgi:hypothetical protein